MTGVAVGYIGSRGSLLLIALDGFADALAFFASSSSLVPSGQGDARRIAAVVSSPSSASCFSRSAALTHDLM